MSSRSIVISMCAVVAVASGSHAGSGSDESELRSAIAKAIPLLEASGEKYRRERTCFSCHHQAAPVIALAIARDRGFKVSIDELKRQGEHALNDLASARATYAKGHSQGGGVTRAGYALWTISAAGLAGDETTATVAGFVLDRDRSSKRWKTSSNRPPSEASDFTTTYVAIRGLRDFGAGLDKAAVESRLADARGWLESARPRDHEDRVFRLLGLAASGSSKAEIERAAAEIIAGRRDDGGWGQMPDMASDAYATGTALYALNIAGGIETTSEVYRRGVAYLLESRAEDGSWHVKSRSKPFQTYFESGFPYKKDQFISMAATSWSVAALSLAVEKPSGEPK